MLTFFWSLEVSGQKIELSLTDDYFGHAEGNSELRIGDVACSKFVKVSEEFINSNASLFTDCSHSCNDVVKVLWGVSNNLGFAHSWLGLGEVFKRVVEVPANSVQVFWTIDVVAEIKVVDFIDVSLVHVPSKNELSNAIRSSNLQ